MSRLPSAWTTDQSSASSVSLVQCAPYPNAACRATASSSAMQAYRNSTRVTAPHPSPAPPATPPTPPLHPPRRGPHHPAAERCSTGPPSPRPPPQPRPTRPQSPPPDPPPPPPF